MSKKRTTKWISLPGHGGLKVWAAFVGGHVTDLGGVSMLQLADKRTGLTARFVSELKDVRQAGKVRHSLLSMVCQRMYGLGEGREDLNDQDALRHNVAMQTAVGRTEPLASASTLCRLEARADRSWAWAAHKAFLGTFVAAHRRPPKRIVLDFDATDDLVHGEQEGRHFNSHYGGHCYLPLHVFAGDHLLASYLRPSKDDPAKHAAGVLRLLVGGLRRSWPDVRITVRADAGFCRRLMLEWCDRNGVDYIVGLPKNARLLRASKPEAERAAAGFKETGEKQRRFSELSYRAGTWARERRVIARIEHSRLGPNPRFVVTSLKGDARSLHEDVHCARGDMENRIKEQQLELFADRTSSSRWWSNQFRLLLSSLAYVLLSAVRRIGLRGTRMAKAQAGTIRRRLLTIGAVVERRARQVRFRLSETCTDRDLLRIAVARLKAG